jgi:hypothetical protein
MLSDMPAISGIHANANAIIGYGAAWHWMGWYWQHVLPMSTRDMLHQVICRQ